MKISVLGSSNLKKEFVQNVRPSVCSAADKLLDQIPPNVLHTYRLGQHRYTSPCSLKIFKTNPLFGKTTPQTLVSLMTQIICSRKIREKTVSTPVIDFHQTRYKYIN